MYLIKLRTRFVSDVMDCIVSYSELKPSIRKVVTRQRDTRMRVTLVCSRLVRIGDYTWCDKKVMRLIFF